MHGVYDLAQIIFDLVHYGGFSYESLMTMPPYERDEYHRLTIDSIKTEREFQAKLHQSTLG